MLEIALVVAVIAAKLALVHDRPLCARGLGHDDLLFLRLSKAILETGWLGFYDPLVLVKGPFLPLFLAGLSRLGMPFLLGQEIAYLAAAVLVLLALAPLVRSRIARLLLFAGLVFNPATLSSDPAIMGVGGAVLTREPLYASLTLMVIAGLTGLWAYRERAWPIRLAWALCLGFSLGPFWLTREEGIWIVPSMAVTLAVLAWPLLRRGVSPRTRYEGAALLALPLALWGAALLLVATINWKHYGVFLTNEFKAHPFRAAYGALTRVRHSEWKPNLPVPRDVRQQLYAASPAFRELQQPLESNAGWFSYGCPFYPHTCGDLTGAWFIWALREAVAGKGHHASATEAAAYHLRLAAEINDACDKGQLSCDPPRESLTDPLHWYHVQEFPDRVATSFWRTLSFSDVHITTEPCRGIEAPWLAMYAAVTHHQVDAPPGLPAPWQTQLSSQILSGYQWAVPRLMAVALLGYLASWLSFLRRRRADLLLPSTVILVALCVRFTLLSAADLISSLPYSPRYYQPNFPLLVLFIAIDVYALIALGWQLLQAVTATPRRSRGMRSQVDQDDQEA